MCGLAGIAVGPTSHVHAGELRRMAASMHHRGPDDEGFALWTPGEAARIGRRVDGTGRLGLAHRRLSILDRSEHGWQPMASADGRHFLVYNGEIYNFIELRRELERAGHRFVSHGDTEVLLAGLIHWGLDEAIRRLEGMYAFAFLDTATATLTLARDPFGIKPLYYAEDGDRFVFASEIKSLFTVSDLRRRANVKAVLAYLAEGVCDHGEETMFAQVKQVPPASIIVVDVLREPRIASRRTSWAPRVMPTMDVSADEAASLVRECFRGNIARHMRSDVPVGATLSGGVDSSSILAVMREAEPAAALHAFTYFADDPSLNEERWARAAANAAGARVHEVYLDFDTLAPDLDALIRTQDEPFTGITVFAQYSVFRVVSAAGIPVVLDGQGADELLGGYASYLGPHIAHLARRGQWAAITQLVQASRGRADVNVATAARYVLAASTPRWVKRRLGSRVRAAMWPSWLDVPWFEARGGLGSLQEYDPGPHLREHLVRSLRTSLAALLRYEDRNSMAFGVESRVPFLTTRFAELALSVPDDYLIAADGTRKAVFRNAMRGIVPDIVLDRRDKLGFHTPEQAILGVARGWAEGVLNSDRAHSLAGISTDGLRRARAFLGNGTHALNIPIWRLLNVIRWADIFDVSFDP